jgi:hypothetical protein
MSLTWTTEPPTEPDWYWVEWESGDRAIVEIEHMVDQDDEDYQGMGFHNGCGWTCLEDVGIVRFAGPIPQPEEGDASA